MEKHTLHLKNPELQTSPEVRRAVEREEQKTSEKVPNDPAERIEAYLKRLERLVLDPDKKQKKKDMGDIGHTKRSRALSLLREMVLDEYVRPNREQMAQGAARVEQRAARQMGVQTEYNDETLEQRGEIAVGDLESSLDEWIKYLSDPNEPYPTWFRYYVFRNILNLGEYDKDRQEFPKRSKGTFKLFPDVDHGALAYVEEIMTAAQDNASLARLREAQQEFGTPEADMWTPQKAQAFMNMSFARQYAEGIKSQGEITSELRAETRGEWVRYRQGDNPKKLWKSLQNRGTAWCTRGYPTARTQLEGGDFYVYYTLDATGRPTIPRIAIRMEGQNKIAEPPRGVFDSQQNLEPNMVDILNSKLTEFGGEADAYRKRNEDIRMLTTLEKKRENDKPFSKDDLVFLYEINGTIEGFGYQEDPRIAELREGRNTDEDMLVVFECTRDEIAHVPSQINEKTKAYVGPICKTTMNPQTRKEEVLPEYVGIFQRLKNLEHVYTSFPDNKIRRENIEIGGHDFGGYIRELESIGITYLYLVNYMEIKKRFDDIDKSKLSKKTKEFVKALISVGVSIDSYTQVMLKNMEFVAGKSPEEATLIIPTVADFGFSSDIITIDQIYERAQILGLELCPSDTGLNYRLKYRNQPLNERIYMGMKQITVLGGDPFVFSLERDNLGLRLGDFLLFPGGEWERNSSYKFVFRLRSPE